jgi:hypothetical protein
MSEVKRLFFLMSEWHLLLNDWINNSLGASIHSQIRTMENTEFFTVNSPCNISFGTVDLNNKLQKMLKWIRSSLLWDVMQHRLAVSYQCLRTTYPFHLQGSSCPRGMPETLRYTVIQRMVWACNVSQRMWHYPIGLVVQVKVNLTLRLFSFNHWNSVLQEGGYTMVMGILIWTPMNKTLQDFHHNEENREVFQDFGLFLLNLQLKW